MGTGPIRPTALLFDLLTALIDSWSLWDAVAGNAAGGRSWRAAYLKNTYAAGGYRPYRTMVHEAAVETGLPAEFADRLVARYAELAPWPEAPEILGALRGKFRFGIVTNCSEALGHIAVARTGISFDVVVTAERAGFYKPDARPYRLALDALGLAAADCLFVAGSAYDLYGGAAVGLPVFWHNRLGLPMPPDAPPPMAEHRTLYPLRELLPGGAG